MTNQKAIKEMLETAIQEARESMIQCLDETEGPLNRLVFLRESFVPLLKELAEIEEKVNSFNR